MVKWQASLTLGLMMAMSGIVAAPADAGHRSGNGGSGQGSFNHGMATVRNAVPVPSRMPMTSTGGKGLNPAVIHTARIPVTSGHTSVKVPALSKLPQITPSTRVNPPIKVPNLTLPHGTLGRFDSIKPAPIKPISTKPVLPGSFPNLASAGSGKSNPIFTMPKSVLPAQGLGQGPKGQKGFGPGFGFCGTPAPKSWGCGWGSGWGWGCGYNPGCGYFPGCGYWPGCTYWPGYFSPCVTYPLYPTCYYTPTYFTTSVVTVAPSTVVADPVPPAPVSAALPEIDLLIQDVKVVEPATATQGALYRITIKNQGPMNLSVPFRVAALGLKETQPTAETPRAMETLAGLKVGESSTVELRMPAAASSLPRLLIAIEIPESFKDLDEQNNVAAGEVSQLALVTAP